ncbi:hypothetical protein FOXG_22110 [Fusarium oxysporum f. sp. lycopersici 4287]|uniref:Uncharacterized protein n=1 Tax=Fusarium oxysporum f. sp. lycopersici (strain 4287 / CBS 123668 / FGSC 9935 / NRRL 34936) TaxID=426428 RepID=A0A0J9W562_FUSO4|nr:hypothetical protein FOXG_22110 [Fusarium oxysporum f. sp. lycopersici 4287]KNB18000.1 hypothetical protein FOXG_22110 [Fusarium oxysporum f. sp. lycopersici 4287]
MVINPGRNGLARSTGAVREVAGQDTVVVERDVKIVSNGEQQEMESTAVLAVFFDANTQVKLSDGTKNPVARRPGAILLQLEVVR